MPPSFNEDLIEQVALQWLTELGYEILHGPDIAPGTANAERDDYGQTVLVDRLRQSLARLNPTLPVSALEEALRKLTRIDGPSLIERNHHSHQLLVNGVEVEYQRADGSIRGAQVQVLDYDDPANNDWLALNQFVVVENKRNRRADVVLIVNGLPLAVIELKNAADEKATIWNAFQQLQTYKAQVPSLFTHNEALVISDGVQARIGTLTADREWFMPWRTVTGEGNAPTTEAELKTILEGVFEQRRFLDLIRYFVVFEDQGGGKLIKKMAGYHQFHAVNVALEETLRATQLTLPPQVGEQRESYTTGRFEAGQQPGGEAGDQRVGVIWHTQGSGKSLTMAFYAGRVIWHPAMQNPTLVVLTDRNDLDDQLFGTFARCKELLRQPPVQAQSRADLRDKLRVDGGGVVFTTIQKFLPETRGDTHPQLSNRRNIIVIADEAHRSQYDFIDGLAANLHDALPNASFIGFTGTPIELTDKNTRAVFGDYISIYDIQQAVADGATVPIYYESRLVKLALNEGVRVNLDEEFDEVTEGEELEQREGLKSRWAQLEALVGADARIAQVAKNLVEHFEQRQEVLEGKGMIVCMSRRICVALYNAIIALRPDWHHPDDAQGMIKVVMTGSATDPLDWQSHIRNKAARESMANRFRDPDDGFKLVIVRDMWLTGFDAPSLHTMYIDKPMHGHGLMQAIARVNRVFRDKPGGLVVDYLGIADALRNALATYTQSGGTGRTAIDQEEAVRVLLAQHKTCINLFYGFDHSKWRTGTPAEKLALLPAAQEHVLKQEDGKARLLRAVTALSQAFALAVPHPETARLRDDVSFFQAVRSVLAKSAPGEGRTPDEMEHAIRQLVSSAIASDEVVDIFQAAGLQKPNIAILSDEFLAEVKAMPQKNLAVELLRKLLTGEIRARNQTNVVQARSFTALLEEAIRRYQNRAIETAQVIEELIALANDMKAAVRRGEELGLSDDELAFYDALEVNDSAVKVLGDPKLRDIARELAISVRNNVTIDWMLRENVRAQLRVLVKRILRKYGYPPDKQEKATQTVLEQAEALSAVWAAV